MTPNGSVAYALSIVGLTAPDARYLRLVAPWEFDHGDARRANEIATESDCALVTHGIIDATLNTPPRARYVVEHALSDLVVFAGDAYLSPHADVEPGDALHFGAAGQHPEHMSTVVAVGMEAYDLLPLERVDGGQRTSEGRETVALIARGLRYDGRVREDITDRPLLGVISFALLAARWGTRG